MGLASRVAMIIPVKYGTIRYVSVLQRDQGSSVTVGR